MPTSVLSLVEVLDTAYEQMSADPRSVPEALAPVGAVLYAEYRLRDPLRWKDTLAICRRHRLGQLLLDDPLTRRSFTQPRGYAGDAELLDIIYARDWRGITPPPTAVGQAIFAHTIHCKAPTAVRQRRDLLAQQIDEACRRTPAPHILSVACGHLRELALSRSYREGLVGRFVGLDQDALSLAEVTRSLPDTAVETIPGSVKLLFGGALAREQFDFIYTAGLYDYLDEPFAQRLTARLFAMLRPGGRLLAANFGEGVEDAGYMEAFMNWTLIYRNEADMHRLAAAVPSGDVAALQIFADSAGAVLYLQLERRG
ncbi:MAG TPA: class I SAM-dependent methyltransferase [Lacunisphaera sp.]|nr:class I SAM-dependent methyltransferase [Lacunisphaera sp.]